MQRTLLTTLLCATVMTTPIFALNHTLSINTSVLTRSSQNSHVQASAKFCYKNIFQPCSDVSVVDAYANVRPSIAFNPSCMLGFGECFQKQYLYSSAAKSITSLAAQDAYIVIKGRSNILYYSTDSLCLADNSIIEVNVENPKQSSCNKKTVTWKWRLF